MTHDARHERTASRPRLDGALACGVALLLVALAIVGSEAFLVSAGASGWNDPAPAPLLRTVSLVRHFGGLAIVALAGVGTLVSTAFIADALLRRREPPTWPMLVAPLLLAGSLISARVAVQLRRDALERAATRLSVVTTAIEAHVRRTGRPPATLAELAPVLQRDPATLGLRGCRELEYRMDTSRAVGVSPGRAWELRMDCPNGFLSLDQFTYAPPLDPVPHGAAERFGDWVYVWD